MPFRINSSLIVSAIILFFNQTLNSQSRILCSPANEFLIEKYKTVNIIAIDEGPHGTLETHQLIRQILTDSILKRTIQKVIIEFANTERQTTLDKFISGIDIPAESVKTIWRSTTQSHSTKFEEPVYLQLLQTIRDINYDLPSDKKIRVLGGDPPIRWREVKTLEDYFACLWQRDIYPSHLAIKYGLDSLQKVLIVFGGEHLKKNSDQQLDSTHWTIPYFIEKVSPGSIVTIGAFNPEILKSPPKNPDVRVGSICDLTLGEIGSLQVEEWGDSSSYTDLKNCFDAVYFLGPSENWHTGYPEKIKLEYWIELNRRSQIVWGDSIDSALIDY